MMNSLLLLGIPNKYQKNLGESLRTLSFDWKSIGKRDLNTILIPPNFAGLEANQLLADFVWVARKNKMSATFISLADWSSIRKSIAFDDDFKEEYSDNTLSLNESLSNVFCLSLADIDKPKITDFYESWLLSLLTYREENKKLTVISVREKKALTPRIISWIEEKALILKGEKK